MTRRREEKKLKLLLSVALATELFKMNREHCVDVLKHYVDIFEIRLKMAINCIQLQTVVCNQSYPCSQSRVIWKHYVYMGQQIVIVWVTNVRIL
jgi:hypothetical protein